MKAIIAMILLLLILKLSGASTLSWIWVFAPLWIPVLTIVVAASMFLLTVLIIEAISKWR